MEDAGGQDRAGVVLEGALTCWFGRPVDVRGRGAGLRMLVEGIGELGGSRCPALAKAVVQRLWRRLHAL